MFVNKCLRIGGGLLFGGFLCVALAAPTAAHASPSVIPMEKVQQLEEAVRKAHRTTVLNLLADTPDNRGREELLAFLDEHQAAATLEYVMQEAFGGVVETKWLLADHSMEVADVTFDSDGEVLTLARFKLLVTLRQPDGSTLTREVAGAMNLQDRRLVLPEGILPGDAKQSQLVTDLLRYRTKLLDRTAEQVTHGKFQSREDVLRAIDEDLKNSAPMQRFLAGTLTPDAVQVVAETLSRAVAGVFNEALIEAIKKAFAR